VQPVHHTRSIAGLAGTIYVGGGVFNPASGAEDVRTVTGPCDGSSGKPGFRSAAPGRTAVTADLRSPRAPGP